MVMKKLLHTMNNFDQHAAELFAKNINMMVPYYLMASYAYYKQDDPIFSDGFFDSMGKTMLACWDDIEHNQQLFLASKSQRLNTLFTKLQSYD